MKKSVLYFLLAVFCCTLSFNSSATTKKSVKIVPAQKKTFKTGPKKKRSRRLKYVSPSKEDLTVENIPLALPIPDEVIKALSMNDLAEAIRTLRTEPPSSRSLYLLREAQRIVLYNKNKKAPKLDRHQFYQNIGIAYHNLFLFLKGRNITSEDFYKGAIKFYKKGSNKGSKAEKREASVLIASIKASNGEVDTAKKIFSKIDTSILEWNLRGLEYLAAYYAATGDASSAVDKLKQAYAMNPSQISLWVAIGDDFLTIRENEEFKKLVSEWKNKTK